MRYNEFSKKLLKHEIGTSIRLQKKDGKIEGTFIRVPSGWIYRFEDRHGNTCCFIPYADELEYYDDNMFLKPCLNCDSTKIMLHYDEHENDFFVRCDKCSAHSGLRNNKDEVIHLWNMKN